jgi:DHA3 family macrolide efflux protein-like MFS transporter
LKVAIQKGEKQLMQAQTETIPVQEESIWKNKNYLFLWVGRTISQFGDKLYLLALPWLVLELTGSVVSATLTMALEIIPQLILAPIIGLLVDRQSRKHMMIITDLLRGILILAIPILYFMEALPIGFIYFTAVVLSILTLLFDSSSEAYIPTILKKEQLMDGNSKLVMVATIMRVVGPAVAGILIAMFGAAITIGINGLTFILSMLFLLFISNMKMVSTGQENEGDKNNKSKVNEVPTFKRRVGSFAADVKEGFLYLVKHPVLWPITLFSALMNFSILGVTSLFIFESKINQGAGADMTAIIFWVSGIFSFIATLLVKPLNKKVSKGQLIRFGALGVGIAIAIVALSPSVITMTICYTLLLMIGIFVNVSMMTLRQEIVPNHMLGRVLASTRVLVQSISPIAIILAGVIAQQWSVQLVFILGTFLIAINVCIAWFGKMRTIA